MYNMKYTNSSATHPIDPPFTTYSNFHFSFSPSPHTPKSVHAVCWLSMFILSRFVSPDTGQWKGNFSDRVGTHWHVSPHPCYRWSKLPAALRTETGTPTSPLPWSPHVTTPISSPRTTPTSSPSSYSASSCNVPCTTWSLPILFQSGWNTYIRGERPWPYPSPHTNQSPARW